MNTFVFSMNIIKQTFPQKCLYNISGLNPDNIVLICLSGTKSSPTFSPPSAPLSSSCSSQTMEDSPQRSVRGQGALPWYVGGSQVLGLACVVITGLWMGHYRGGYAWDGSAQEFNVHPLCMVLGLVFLYGDG